MIILLTALAFASIDQLPGKALPSIKEPDWDTWKGADPGAKAKATEAWAILCQHRPDREYKNEVEQRDAEKRVEAAYKSLEANPTAACAAGAAAIRASKDDWERIMIATAVRQLGGDQGEPFLLWVMAKATVVDATFEPVFGMASDLASKRRPEYLPAIFSMLRCMRGTSICRFTPGRSPRTNASSTCSDAMDLRSSLFSIRC